MVGIGEERLDNVNAAADKIGKEGDEALRISPNPPAFFWTRWLLPWFLLPRTMCAAWAVLFLYNPRKWLGS